MRIVALEILRRAEPGRAEREAALLDGGYPAYTTTPGWLGYDGDKLRRLCKEAVEQGFKQVKLKVGADLADDVRRLRIARDVCGPDVRIAVDANQRWDVGPAVEWVRAGRVRAVVSGGADQPLLLAAKFGVPVCPHAGGVGLCEMVRHLSMFDFVAVSASMDDRVIELADHPHEHFVDPAVVRDGRYVAPTAPGFSVTMRPQTLVDYAYPDGPIWS